VVLVTGGGSGIGAAAAQRLAHEGAAAAQAGPRRAILGAVDLALLHGCEPGVYRWRLDPTASAAA
jgi:uncharacterized protein